MKIRKIKKAELKSVGKLMLKEFSRPPFNEDAGINDVFESLMFYYENAKIYVVEDSEIMGAIVFQVERWWEGRVVVIQDLFAVKSLKGDIVDKYLMEFLEEYCCENNIVKICFETNKKSSSIKSYKKMGYKINKDRVSMEKKIKW